MKDALNSFLGGKGKEDPTAGAAGTAAPYEGDFNLADEEGDDMAEGGDTLAEVQGLLAGASEDQLMQIKGILTAPKEGPESAGVGTGAEMSPGMGTDLGAM